MEFALNFMKSNLAIESPALKGGKKGWNMHAATTHSGTAYTGRAGAPFALVDDTLSVIELLCQGRADARLPLLYMNWSPNNVRVSGDEAKGEIGIPHFASCAAKEDGVCVGGIYMGGKEHLDTDEYDDHITGHEVGHFIERRFFRSDNMGGSHNVGAVVDVAMAWGEGYGTAMGGLALGDPVFVDTSGKAGQKGWELDLSKARPSADRGIYSETATARLLYLLWDRRDGTVGNGVGSFDRIFKVMSELMAPGPSYSSALAFGAYYNATWGGDADGLRALWQGDFATPYDALCKGNCKGKGDVADPFDSDNDVGRAYSAFKLYPDPYRKGAAKRAPGFWRLYQPLAIGVHTATAHDAFVGGYPAPKMSSNKVGTNRHYLLVGTGKPMTVALTDLKTAGGKGCGGNHKLFMWAYTVGAPRTRQTVGQSFAACPSVTFETDKGRHYLLRLYGAYEVGAGWTYPGGPEVTASGWTISVTEN